MVESYNSERMFNNLLSNKLANFGKKYYSSNRPNFKGSSLGRIVKKELPTLITDLVGIDKKKYKIKGSIGQGQYAEITWISIFDRFITESASKGIYIVFLYSTDGKSVYLSLNQGYTYFSNRFSEKKALEEVRKMANNLRSTISNNNSNYVDKINLTANSSLGKGYEAGHIIGFKYNFDNMPTDDVIVRDITDLMDIYKSIKNKLNNRTIEQFYDYLISIANGSLRLTTIEKEINTENIESTSVESNQVINDVPKKKQEVVVDNAGKQRYPRDSKIASQALVNAGFKCECDANHKTFKTKDSNHQYMEAHHLIPISKSDLFEHSIDVEANIISLCSICHDCIHHGTDEDKAKLIEKLYNKRKTRLENAGISVQIDQLKSFYDIN